jgi:hypothetical protein
MHNFVPPFLLIPHFLPVPTFLLVLLFTLHPEMRARKLKASWVLDAVPVFVHPLLLLALPLLPLPLLLLHYL